MVLQVSEPQNKEAYPQTARRPAKPLISARFGRAVNKPQEIMTDRRRPDSPGPRLWALFMWVFVIGFVVVRVG